MIVGGKVNAEIENAAAKMGKPAAEPPHREQLFVVNPMDAPLE